MLFAFDVEIENDAIPLVVVIMLLLFYEFERICNYGHEAKSMRQDLIRDYTRILDDLHFVNGHGGDLK